MHKKIIRKQINDLLDDCDRYCNQAKKQRSCSNLCFNYAKIRSLGELLENTHKDINTYLDSKKQIINVHHLAKYLDVEVSVVIKLLNRHPDVYTVISNEGETVYMQRKFDYRGYDKYEYKTEYSKNHIG